jgi:hypothetical protein
MVLETLLNSDIDGFDLPLNRVGILLNKTQCSHNLSISSIIRRRLRSSLRRGSSCRWLKLNWKKLWSFSLTFIPQLGIRLHKCLTPKRILNFHYELSRDVGHNLKTNLREQARERKTCSMIISHLKQCVEDVLV